jgi:hypothetical protein
MLSPTFLGLPLAVQGVPFVQSLVIIHMIITGLLLLYSVYCSVWDFWYAELVHEREVEHFKTRTAARGDAGKVLKGWAQTLGLEIEFAQKPSDTWRMKPKNGDVVSPGSHVRPDILRAPSDDGKGTMAESQAFDGMRAIAELVFLGPILANGRDPTCPSGIWHPFHDGKTFLNPFGLVGKLKPYGKELEKRRKRDCKLVWIVPSMFLLAWVIDLLIYFA